MSSPTYCTSCGHELGIGRFCTNCGKPVPGRHPAATSVDEPAAPPVGPPPVLPPPAGAAPPAVRYPLYADAGPGAATSTLPETPGAPGGPPPPPPADDSRRRDRRRWLPWLVGALLVVLVATVGVVLLVRSAGEDSAADDARPDATAGSDPTGSTAPPDAEGTEEPVEQPDPDDVEDVSREARATVPEVAPPSRDRQNQPVTFDAANLLDGRTRTSWRMSGDGSGRTITFDLGREVVLTEVGIINGYAKIDGPDNWYRGNRRLRAVQWELDDGTRVTQELKDRRTLQTLRIEPVRTSSVRLLLVEVSAPGTGPNGRDFTAISEVALRGAPA